jgi:hypothetical protein
VIYQHEQIISAEPQPLIKGVVAVVAWTAYGVPERNYVVCSARIQRSDGSWVGPTRLMPYQTPTPTGGEYVETTNPATRYRQVIVTFAKAAAPAGASCNYPLMVRAGYSAGNENVEASFRVNTPTKGMDEVAVTIHTAGTIVCRATAEERAIPTTLHGMPPEFVRPFPITIPPDGGLSSPVPTPTASNNALIVKVYVRLPHSALAAKANGRT